MSDEGGEQPPKRDVLLVGPRLEEGEGHRVLRARGDALEVGEIRPTKDGQPIHGELVKLTPRERQPGLFDVDVLADQRVAATADRRGPAKVATNAYRAGWDAIFGAADDDESRPN